MNKAMQEIYPHRCVTSNTASSKCHFCRICGIHMSKNSNGPKYFRSEKFDVLDPFRVDGNVAIIQMVQKQSNNRYYNTQANHISYRNELIGFVEELAVKLDYKESTFHLAIGILDALLSLYTIDRKQIKIVSFMALNLAAKMEENNSKIPEMNAIGQLFENEFSYDELVSCETLLTKVLGYNLNIKTPFTFVEHFLSKGVVSDKDLHVKTQYQINEKIEQFEKLVSFFLQTTLNHYNFYKYTSVAVAASAIACARKLMGFENIWTSELENLTLVRWESIEQCSMMLFEAAKDIYPILTPEAVLGLTFEEFECPALIQRLKSRGSILTEATSEKDDHFDDQPEISEFKLFDSDDEEFVEPMKFILQFEHNSR